MNTTTSAEGRSQLIHAHPHPGSGGPNPPSETSLGDRADDAADDGFADHTGASEAGPATSPLLRQEPARQMRPGCPPQSEALSLSPELFDPHDRSAHSKKVPGSDGLVPGVRNPAACPAGNGGSDLLAQRHRARAAAGHQGHGHEPAPRSLRAADPQPARASNAANGLRDRPRGWEMPHSCHQTPIATRTSR